MGKIVAGYLADTFGRRWIYVFGGIGTAAFLPIVVMLNAPGTSSFYSRYSGSCMVCPTA